MSFTRGTLFLHESLTLLDLHEKNADWKEVRRQVIAENLLQARTETTLKNCCGEIISRLKQLTSDECSWILQANNREQAYLLWVATCRRYTFIGDFAVEVLRERYLNLHAEISTEDYDIFFNRKAEWHDELDRLTSSTRQKLRQVVFKMMRQAGLISEDFAIIPVMLSADFTSLLRAHPLRNDCNLFPVFDSDLPST